MKYNVLFDGKKTFGPIESSIGEFVYILLQNAVLGVLTLLVALRIPYNATMQYLFQFLIEATFLATVLIVCRASKTACVYGCKLHKKMSLKQVGFVVLLSLIALYGFSSITDSFVGFLTNVGYKSYAAGIQVTSWGKYFLFVFLMGLVPAFCEEMLFRGVVYQGLKTWNKKGAVIVSALCFMLMHGSPDQTIHQFLLGIVLALLFDATGTILAPMLLHFLNNFIALTTNFAFYRLTKGQVVEQVDGTAKVNWSNWAVDMIVALLIFALAAYLIWIIIKYLKADRLKQEATKTAGVTAEPGQGAGDGAAQQQQDAQQMNMQQQQDAQQLAAQQETANMGEPTQGDEYQEQVQTMLSDRSKRLTIALFAISGAYLVIEWLRVLVAGLL